MSTPFKVYIAAPLFDSMELARNADLARMLELMNYEVYLPQRDSGEAANSVDRDFLFNADVHGLRGADVVVALLDGRVPDEGTCFEVGAAWALDIPVIAICTDRRSFMDGHPNVMLEKGVTATYPRTYDAVLHLDILRAQKSERKLGE